MEKGLVRSLEQINYRIFIAYKSACSGFRLKHYDFPSTPPVGVQFFSAVCSIYLGSQKKIDRQLFCPLRGYCGSGQSAGTAGVISVVLPLCRVCS